jgi:hypothetical protein
MVGISLPCQAAESQKLSLCPWENILSIVANRAILRDLSFVLKDICLIVT